MKMGFDDLNQRIAYAQRVWLFLDYDGTLADFAPTPHIIEPDNDLIKLLHKIVQLPYLRLAVISGRRQSHLDALLPVPGAILGGAYGIELRTADGDRIQRADLQTIRPTLEHLQPRWERLIDNRSGFILEDKEWTLALHAKLAEASEFQKIMREARTVAKEMIEPRTFRIYNGRRFLEVAPVEAEKGQTVKYLLQRFPLDNPLILYIGDDDKDENAFEVVKSRGGIPVVVADEPRETEALYRLDSTQAVRQWLEGLYFRRSQP
jgi:trehalose 6-phosphate phosphatase